MDLIPALSGTFGDHPDAVTADGQRMSWEELRGAATATADRITGATAVAIDATATLQTVVGIAGALIAGVPAVPLPPDAGSAERAHLLADSGAVVLPPVDLRARSATTHPPVPPEATALVLYTSGTTGPPKGAPVTRAAIAAGLDALASAWEWSTVDILGHGLPLFHVHGLVLGVLGPLRLGSRLVHTGRPTPRGYAAAEASLYFGVPTVWSRICADRASARALTGARLLVSGSAPLPASVFAELEALTGHRPVERYGMTETLITLSTRAAGARVPGTVGLPLAGIETRLVDDADRPVPADGASVGELQVRGSTVFAGYLHRPDATAAAFTVDGWFRTGDAATIDSDGVHRIVGRTAVDLIKTGGFRVGAGEVEDALLTHPSVREAAVVGAPHEDLGQEIVAYVVTSSALPEAELIAFVAGRLSAHKRPRRVIFVDGLPRNAVGKVQKRLLS